VRVRECGPQPQPASVVNRPANRHRKLANRRDRSADRRLPRAVAAECCRCRWPSDEDSGERSAALPKPNQLILQERKGGIPRSPARTKVHRNIVLRSQLIRAFSGAYRAGFNGVQTPILTSELPEVPATSWGRSRMQPRQFLRAAQAPQRFKQLLRWRLRPLLFPIEPCFRDEDSRAEPYPGEFYQLDFEMCSFVPRRTCFAASGRCCTACSRKSPTAASDAPAVSAHRLLRRPAALGV